MAGLDSISNGPDAMLWKFLSHLLLGPIPGRDQPRNLPLGGYNTRAENLIGPGWYNRGRSPAIM